MKAFSELNNDINKAIIILIRKRLGITFPLLESEGKIDYQKA